MRYDISATSIRVFSGFKKASLADEQFFQIVSHTFMPGTPYMLRDLGLASYTSGVLMDVADASMPQEFALIGYAGAGTYHSPMTDTLQGRMYLQSHGGVYDTNRSKAAFPVALSHLATLEANPFFAWGETTDWH